MMLKVDWENVKAASVTCVVICLLEKRGVYGSLFLFFKSTGAVLKIVITICVMLISSSFIFDKFSLV